MPQQFENSANPEIHRKTTAIEIINDLEGAPDGSLRGRHSGTITVSEKSCGKRTLISG